MLLEVLRRYLRPQEVARLTTAATAPQSTRDIPLAELVCKALTLEAFDQSSTPVGTWAPHVLVQYWDQSRPPSDVADCIASWASNGDLPHQLFDDAMARLFIAEHYDADHLNAFDHCHHPAMRSDYFRLTYIARKGGCYIDADERRIGGPLPMSQMTRAGLSLRSIFRSAAGGPIIASERRQIADALRAGRAKAYFANDPIVARPDHPVTRWALGRATRLILDARARSETCRIHWTTGPDNITFAVLDHALGCLRLGMAADVGVLTGWTDIATWERDLTYRQTRRDWRLDRPTDPSRSLLRVAAAPRKKWC